MGTPARGSASEAARAEGRFFRSAVAGPAANLIIDRDAAGRFGISPADIDAAIYNQVGQRQVAQYFTAQRLSRDHGSAAGSADRAGAVQCRASGVAAHGQAGAAAPRSVKVDTAKTRSLAISHQGQFPASTISFNLSPGVSLGVATAAVERARQSLGMPATLQGSFQGNAQAFQESLKDQPVLILAALLSVYVILGVLYESYIHPLTILSTLPSAGLGALLALRLAGHDLDVIGIIAIILLIGIVKKNGIMIVDVALTLEREQRMDPEEAVRRASHQRAAADSHDYRVCVSGWPADDHRRRHGLGVSAAPGLGDRRWVDRVAGDDVVYYAGDLSVSRSDSAAVRT